MAGQFFYDAESGGPVFRNGDGADLTEQEAMVIAAARMGVALEMIADGLHAIADAITEHTITEQRRQS